MNTRSAACLVASLAVAGLSPAASAGLFSVSQIGGAVNLNSGPLSTTVFGNAAPGWSTASLASVHAALNSAGISTNGKVTFVPADTDRGLAFLALVDQQINPQPPIAQGNLHMDTIGNAASIAYVNNPTAFPINESSAGSQIASGDLNWNTNGAGVGYAWAGLNNGDTMTFRFNVIPGQAVGLDQPSTFQFVTWTGSTWSVVALPASQTSFTPTGDFGFSVVTAVPTPASMTLAGLGLGVASLRRRR